MATANKNGDVFTAEAMRGITQAQAQQREYRILQVMREQEARQQHARRLVRHMNLLLGAHGMPPFVVRVDQHTQERIKYVEVEIVDTKPKPKQLPPPRRGPHV